MAGGKKQGLSVRAFAADIGVTENAVRSRIKSGKRIAEAVFDDGSLDADRARALWYVDLNAANIRGAKKPDRAAIADQAEEAINLNRVKQEREQVDLDLQKIKLSREEGSVIDREEAKRGAAAFARVYRDGVLNFAGRSGADLAHQVGADPRLLIPALDAALRQLLVDMVAQPMPFE